MRSRTIGLAALVAACLTIAGCSAAPSVPKPPKQSAASTAGAAQATDDVAAIRAFDGDCSAALSESESATLLGVGAAVRTDDVQSADIADFGAERAAFDAAGGLACAWQGADGGGLQIAVLPLDVVTAQRIDAAAPTTCAPAPSGGQRCAIELSVSESWLMVSGTSRDVVNGALAPIGSRLVDQHPEAASPRAGEWSVVPCFAAGQFIQIATGAAGTLTPNAAAADPIRVVLAEAGRLVRCAYTDLTDGVTSLTWEAVAGVAKDDLTLDGFTPADVAGVSQAWTNADGTVLAVQVGAASPDTAANMLLINATGAQASAAMAKLATALIASMPQTVVPAA